MLWGARNLILAFLVVLGLVSIFQSSTVTTTFRSNSTVIEVSYDGVGIGSTTSSPLPLWKDKLRASEDFTGFRYVEELGRNVPLKVSSSSNNNMHKSWIGLPLPTNSTPEAAFVTKTFRYAVIRDPLERLYSGYYNKCIKSPDYENLCTGWNQTMRKANPPTFSEFLERNSRTNFRIMHQNGHYKPITKMFPDLDRMDHVFRMGDTNYNGDVAHMWKRLGANHTMVEHIFPVDKPRPRRTYESRTTLDTIQQHFQDCMTLHLGVRACKADYQGKFAERFFPTPQWVLAKLKECGISEPIGSKEAAARDQL